MFRRLPVSMLALVVLIGDAWAQSDEVDTYAAYAEAYDAYTTAFEAGDLESALDPARLAYEYGAIHFGSDSSSTAILAMNYAKTLTRVSDDRSLAAQLFSEADSIYQALHGSESLQRIDALFGLASIQETVEEALEPVNTALEIQRAVLPDDDIAYARIQTHAGDLLVSNPMFRSEASIILAQALDTLEEEFGNESVELLPTLVALGIASAVDESNRRQRRIFERALEIAESKEPDTAVVDIKVRIALELWSLSGGFQYSTPYLSSAVEDYKLLFGTAHPETAQATATLGQAFIANGEDEQGIIAVEDAIDFYEGKPEYISELIRARQLLMSVYWSREDDEQYTQQLVEVGRLSEGLPASVDYLPIVKTAPLYPLQAWECYAEGHVILEYTVDEHGRVRDPFVVESETTCGRDDLFDGPALESAEAYRYIPRFENGVAVSVPGVRTRIEFVVED